MGVSRGHRRWAGAALLGAALAVAPVFAASVSPAKRAAPRAQLAAPGSLGSFTPAAADPRLAASFARAGLSGGSGFRFTPAAAPGSRRAVTVAVRARATTREEAERAASTTPTAITPTAYNLGVAVGWKRFAITGDVAKIDTGILPGGREAADVALSYSGQKWSTRLKVAAERATGDQRLIDNDQAYTVDLGGSYSLSRNLEVTGGMRYRLQRDRVSQFADDRRDAQAVYIGTAFKF